MIYLMILAIVLAAIGFFYRSRTSGVFSTILDALLAAVLGWAAGLLIGIGARVGMWAVPFFNGAESRFTLEGTLHVILTFSLFGVGLGILYELLFRSLVRKRGWIFGLLIALVTWYPLGSQGVQLLNYSPDLIPAAFFTFVFVGMMFLPFAITIEWLLKHWHRPAITARDPDPKHC